MAERKMMSPKTTLWWGPLSTFANPAAPTAAEINSMVNISCAVVQGYTLGPSGSDSDDTGSVCANSNASTFIFPNYEMNMSFFRDANLADATSVFNKAWTLFKDGKAAGWIARRVGYSNTTLAAAGQDVSIFMFETDYPSDVDDNTTPKQFTVSSAASGQLYTHKTLV